MRDNRERLNDILEAIEQVENIQQVVAPPLTKVS